MPYLLAVLSLAGLACSLPIVDPGLFVILGVRTCGDGGGYCLLGTDCTLDRDFERDTVGGHCDGLRYAFTPPAHFVCCRYVERSNTTLPGEPGPGQEDEFTTTEDPGPDRDHDRETAMPTASSSTDPSQADDLENAIEVEGPAGPSSSAPDADDSALTRDKEQAAADPSAFSPSALPDTSNAVEQEQEQDQVLVAASCPGSSTGEVHPCWRTSFVDRAGATLCSGSMVGVESAVTTAVCANRLLEAGLASVTMRVAESELHVRAVSVHEGYQPGSSQNDIAVVRLLSARAEEGPVPVPVPAVPASCIACLPPLGPASAGTCFALAARFNGLGEESSAVCAGTVVSTLGGLLTLSGCEVATLKSDVMKGQGPAVLAREGAALLCHGGLVGLASTSVGSYLSLATHRSWLSRTLSVTHHFFRA